MTLASPFQMRSSNLCDVRTVRNVRNYSARRGATFRTRAARLIADARADQSSANNGEPEFRTIRTVRTSQDLLDAFFERAAALEYDDGAPRRTAEQTAAEALGFASRDALFASVAADWRSTIVEAEATAAASDPMRRVIQDAKRLIDGGVVIDALSAGWDALSLWSVQTTGAATTPLGLALKLKGRSVAAFNPVAATLTDGSRILLPVVDAARGAILFWQVHQRGFDYDA